MGRMTMKSTRSVLDHSPVRLLVRSHCSLIRSHSSLNRSLCTASFARERRCTRSFGLGIECVDVKSFQPIVGWYVEGSLNEESMVLDREKRRNSKRKNRRKDLH